MLQKNYRLPATTRLQVTASLHTPHFILKIADNSFPYSRFGFVISKKIDKRATVRNRIRRVLRSCIEELFPTIIAGKDMLFFPKSSILEKKHEDLYNEVRAFLNEKKLLR